MVDWFLNKLNIKMSDHSRGHSLEEDRGLKPIKSGQYLKGLEEIDAETPDEHRMLDDLEKDLEKLD